MRSKLRHTKNEKKKKNADKKYCLNVVAVENGGSSFPPNGIQATVRWPWVYSLAVNKLTFFFRRHVHTGCNSFAFEINHCYTHRVTGKSFKSCDNVRLFRNPNLFRKPDFTSYCFVVNLITNQYTRIIFLRE